MSWFGRSQTVPSKNSPGAAIDLRGLAGLSGHLQFAHGLRAQSMTSIPCRVVQVDRNGITVEPTGGSARPGTEEAVILEVIHHSAVLQCFTSVDRVERSGVTILRVPARPHIVQRRRNPRVDIYLGVTLHTPDRPIEETPAQMINLSLDGAACVLTEPLAPGTIISLNLSPLGVDPPQVPAEVVRCVPTPTRLWVLGLRFGGMNPAQTAFLSHYITTFMQTQVQGDGAES